MSGGDHTFGPTCLFHEYGPASASEDSLEAPPLKAQFFYISAIPIDDPLSPLPPISSDSKSAQSQQPRPFSVRDNAALTEAWQGIEPLRARRQSKAGYLSLRPSVGERGTTLGELVRFPRFRGDGSSPPTRRSYLTDKKAACPSDSNVDSAPTQSPDSRTRTSSLLSASQKLKKPHTDGLEESTANTVERDGQKRRRRFSPFRKATAAGDGAGPMPSPTPLPQPGEESKTDISRRPFARAPTFMLPTDHGDEDEKPTDEESQPHQEKVSSASRSSPGHAKPYNKIHPETDDITDDVPDDEKTLVPVGVSRLHLVEMPDLLLKPIYWSPVNDVSAVLRGTWFYAKTMLPVESDLANSLEIGYNELQPWTDTWQDELNSCVEIGAEAEVKVVYHLFPDIKSGRPTSGTGRRPNTSDTSQRDQIFSPQPSVSHSSVAAGPLSPRFRVAELDTAQRYRNHRVAYVNATDAQILRPSLAPSISRNRRPLGAVRKGREIGVPVCRGFNRRSWSKLNPPTKMSSRAAHAAVGAYISQSGEADTQEQHISCPVCRIEQQKRAPRVTDLVLVIHGIGQKLSERMDSFHFTHAINSFRREVNVELSSEVIRGSIRKEQGGIMVLPVNWRLTVSFDDDVGLKDHDTANKFQLEDITPDTLPAVRSLISDVMLDIPYYLSHHKQKMISAVIKEANRVYRLWCRNNPGFEESGRVHLIAHSLGAAMAIDILSQQPTIPPKLGDASPDEAKESMFEFDTKSLFSCGSPAGFFLLLNKANLTPRLGRRRPGTDGDEEGAPTGEAGKYGCLAVDNVYNVMAPYDPISYRMNAAVDRDYAATLKPAIIPGTRQGVLASLGLKWGSSNPEASFGLALASQSAAAQRPAISKLPSTIEMDTHNFTREEVAEKTMYMLNDNGQIDFTLSADGGPLDFQYWNMLSAHSSYWLRQDFVRFLVVEIGRERGRQGTLTALRAQKKRVFKSAKLA